MSDFWRPSDSQDVVIRPLDKGMITDRPSQVLPAGAFLRLKNFISTSRGLRRRPGFVTYALGDTIGSRLVDMVTLWTSDGGQQTFIIAEDFLYQIGPITGFSPIYWEYDSGTMRISGLEVIGSGTSWETQGLLPGDYFAGIDTGGSTAMIEILSITNNIRMTLTALVGGTFGTGSDYVVRRSFGSEKPYLTDWTVFGNELIFASQRNELTTYNTSVGKVLPFIEDPGDRWVNGKFTAACITSFINRIYCGNIEDSTDGHIRHRIIWSSATDSRDFSTVDSTNYVDLPYTSGELLRLVPMGRILVAYFGDAVFFGTISNQPLLPVIFNSVETGGNGLMGQKAVVPWLDGHFAVFQDDIYFVSNAGLRPIGSQVVKDTIHACKEPWRIYAVADPVRFRICFGFPEENENIEKIWSYEYRTQSWSYDEVSTDMIANPLVNLSLEWDDMGTVEWETLSQFTWDDMEIKDPLRTIYVEQSGGLWQLKEDAMDDIGTPINGEIITPDYDFNTPNDLKTATRLSIKLDLSVELTETLEFTVTGSANKGRSWKPLGTLKIRAGYDEGYCNFRMVGSTLRFKLTTSGHVPSYHITELVLSLQPSGKESRLGTQSK